MNASEDLAPVGACNYWNLQILMKIVSIWCWFGSADVNLAAVIVRNGISQTNWWAAEPRDVGVTRAN